MINLVIALDCEAKPVIGHFHLQRQQQLAFPVYSGENMQLIISGIGKLNAASATAYLAGITSNNAAWLNIGIAGHKQHAIGSSYIAHKIIDHATQQNWYPALTFKTELTSESLVTFDHPVTDYHDNFLHDMEAAGFYQAALRFNSIEFIHCLKIVSDNAEQPTHKINKQMVLELLSTQINVIINFIDNLSHQQSEWQNITRLPADYAELLRRWHFSTYQQHQLKQFTQRWKTLYPEREILSTELASLKNSRDVLRYLEDAFDIVKTV